MVVFGRTRSQVGPTVSGWTFDHSAINEFLSWWDLNPWFPGWSFRKYCVIGVKSRKKCTFYFLSRDPDQEGED